MRNKSNGKHKAPEQLTGLEREVYDRLEFRGRTATDMAKELELEDGEAAVNQACLALIKAGLVTTGAPAEGKALYVRLDSKEPAGEEGNTCPGERTIMLLRRGKILAILEHNGPSKPFSTALLVKGLHVSGDRDLEGASAPEVEADLSALSKVKFVEYRAGGVGKETGWILTLTGETELEHSKSYAKLAEDSIVFEETPGEAEEKPGANGAANGATTWADAAASAAAKEGDEKAARKGKKQSKEPSPQLGLSDRPGRFTMSLPCSVPEEELLKLQRDHIAVCDERDALDDERSATMKRFKERLDAIDERERGARTAVKEGLEGRRYQDVECEKKLDGSTISIYRLDTGEKIEERAARVAELEAVNPPTPSTPLPVGAEVREAAPPPPPKPSAEDAVRSALGDEELAKTEVIARAGGDPKEAAMAFERLRAEGEIVGGGRGRGAKYRRARSGAEAATGAQA